MSVSFHYEVQTKYSSRRPCIDNIIVTCKLQPETNVSGGVPVEWKFFSIVTIFVVLVFLVVFVFFAFLVIGACPEPVERVFLAYISSHRSPLRLPSPTAQLGSAPPRSL